MDLYLVAEGDGGADTVRLKCCLHDFHDAHELLMGNDLRLDSVDGLDEVAVEIVYIRFGTLDLVGNGRLVVARCHGLGQSCRGDNGLDIKLFPFLAKNHLGVVVPTVDGGGAVHTCHKEAGQRDEATGADLNMTHKSALKEQVELEAVVHLVIGQVVATAVYLFNLAIVGDSNHLVDQMYAPVKDHAAAVLLLGTPVAGNTAGAVIAGFNGEHVAQLSAAVKLLHHQIVHVPTAVLMGGEEAIVFMRGINDLLQIGGGECDGLFADNVLAAGHCLDGKGVVKLIGDGDDHNVHRGVRKNLFPRAVSMDAVFLGDLSALGIDIVYTNQIDYIVSADKASVSAAHSAVSDNGDVLFAVFHFLFSLSVKKFAGLRLESIDNYKTNH